MPTAAASPLLEGLRRGEAGAIERVVAAYGPYLRMLVRRHLAGQLRSKIDSVDVVQSVWVHMLRAVGTGAWRVPDEDALRSLLATVARRRLVSRFRHHRSALEHERPAPAELAEVSAAPQPRPSEVAQADELWQRLLDLCPPAHHDLLRLRRQGLSLNEVAARTGLHEGSVRRVLRQLASQLALQSKDEG